MAKGLLVAAFDFSTAHADEFHDWYDLEHMPERRAIPGFGACERWIGEEEPTFSVATYDLDSIDVLRGEAYASIAYGNLSVWSKRVTAMCKRLLRFEGTRGNKLKLVRAMKGIQPNAQICAFGLRNRHQSRRLPTRREPVCLSAGAFLHACW
jgi:hypothetical protein